MNARLIITLVLGVVGVGILGAVAGATIPGASDSVLPALVTGVVAGVFVPMALRRNRHSGD